MSEATHGVLEVADDDELFAIYIWWLRAARLFYTHEELSEATLMHLATGRAIDVVYNGVPVLDADSRRNLVAMTWPTKPEARTSPEAWDRSPLQLAVDINANFAMIAGRWWLQHKRQPVLDQGGLLEIGEALGTVGINAGLLDDHLRLLLTRRPQAACGTDLLRWCIALHLNFVATTTAHGDGRLDLVDLDDETATGGGVWSIDPKALVQDLVTEQQLFGYRADITEQISINPPSRVHALRIAPFGPPPPFGSKYYSLFRFLDDSAREKFRVSLDDLAEKYQQTYIEDGVESAKHFLPRSARRHRNWWSNAKRSPHTGKFESVGSQPQRKAWHCAGFTAHPEVESTGAVTHVVFEAVPGRTWWRPLRHILRSGSLSDDARAKQFERIAMENGVHVHKWFMGSPTTMIERMIQAATAESQDGGGDQ